MSQLTKEKEKREALLAGPPPLGLEAPVLLGRGGAPLLLLGQGGVTLLLLGQDEERCCYCWDEDGCCHSWASPVVAGG